MDPQKVRYVLVSRGRNGLPEIDEHEIEGENVLPRTLEVVGRLLDEKRTLKMKFVSLTIMSHD